MVCIMHSSHDGNEKKWNKKKQFVDCKKRRTDATTRVEGGKRLITTEILQRRQPRKKPQRSRWWAVGGRRDDGLKSRLLSRCVMLRSRHFVYTFGWCCPLMTGLLLLLFRWTPYGGAAPRTGVPTTVAGAAACGARLNRKAWCGGGGCGAAARSLPLVPAAVPWLTIVPQVSLVPGGRATTAPFWRSSSIVRRRRRNSLRTVRDGREKRYLLWIPADTFG